MSHPGLKKYKITIPPQLKKEKYGFCFDNYKLPFEQDWGNHPYKFNDERLIQRLDHGRNYGVIGGIGDIMIADADTQNVIDAFNKLMETFTITTGNGEHFYYDVPGLDKSYALSEIDKEETKKQTEKKGEPVLVLKNIGHITSTGRQAVGPNCPHYNQISKETFEPSGKYYRIKKDLPIKTITKEILLETIKPFLAENIRASYENPQQNSKQDQANRLNIPIQKIVDVILKEHPDWLETSTSPIGYRGHNPSHPQSKSRMDLTINTAMSGKYSNWWICSACCHNGYGYGNALYLIALYEGILQCHECKAEGLRGENFIKVMELAINKYGIPKESFHSDLYKKRGQDPSISIDGDLPLTTNNDDALTNGAYIDDASFIGRFTRYFDKRTNAPWTYATHLCILLIGHVMGWKTINRLQPKAVHHNINMLLMGPSGKARKSTAQELARDVYLQEYAMPDGFSPEGYLKHLAESGAQGIGYLGEFSTLLRGINNGGPLANFKEVTNDLYNCPEIYVKRLSKEKDSFTIERPYLSIISTCTEEGMIPNLNQDIVHGGFLPRYIMVYGTSKYRKLQKLSPDIEKEESYFRSAFRTLKLLFENETVLFELTSDGEDALDEICRELEENSYWNGVSPFIARTPNNIVKYADILKISNLIGTSQLSSLSSLSSLSQLSQLTHTHTISPRDEHNNEKDNKKNDSRCVLDSSANRDNRDNRDNRETKNIVITINSDYIKKAWNLLKPTLEYTRKFVRYVDEDLTLSKVESVIEKFSPVERSRALQYSHLKNKDFNEAVETLQDRESIFSLAIINTVRGRKRTKFVFCSRKFIASKKCNGCIYHCKEEERTPHLHEMTVSDEHSDVVITAKTKPEAKEFYVEGPPAQSEFKGDSEPEKVYTPVDVKEYVKKVENSIGSPGLTDELLTDQFPFSLIAGLIESQQLVPVFDNSGFHKYTWCNEEKIMDLHEVKFLQKKKR